jgi:hypothetical protein
MAKAIKKTAKTKTPIPVVDKPLKWWSVINRYYADGERVHFRCMRGPNYVEGDGVIVSVTRNDMGRVDYKVKPDDKKVLREASREEQKEGLMHPLLEDLVGGPWFQRSGREYGEKKDTATPPEKVFEFRVETDDRGHQTLHKSYRGMGEMEAFGWLRIVAREAEVRLIETWTFSPDACSYCGLHASQVGLLIAGHHNTRICSECVGKCNEIIADKRRAGAGRGDNSATP